MDIGSIFLILALLIPVAIFVIRPLIERTTASNMPAEGDISALLAERDQVVASLQELDADYNLGKIPADNYPAQRMSLLQNGADILRKIDEGQMTIHGSSAEDRLEAAIGARRLSFNPAHVSGRKNGNAVPPVPDDDLEQRIASRRRTMEGKAGGFCPKCGRPIHETDHFCPRCGATLV